MSVVLMGDFEGRDAAPKADEMSFAEYTLRVNKIHHRVKNNLQVLISLFSLQANRTTQPEVLDMLAEMQNRVRAIAYIHEPLYSSDDFSAIHFGEYLNKFVRELQLSFGLGSRVQVEFSLADLALDVADAVPLALISNELVSNALKYAFPDNRSGKISIVLRYAGGRPQTDESEWGELRIMDDGVGLPHGIDFLTVESMGFYIVRTLIQQLRGKVDVRGDNGTSISIQFPLTTGLA